MQKVATMSGLAAGAHKLEIDGETVCLVRIGDAVYALDDTCSHADASLSEGELYDDDLEIECPLHGSTFSLTDGEPQCLPATEPVRVWQVAVDGDDVLVGRGDA